MHLVRAAVFFALGGAASSVVAVFCAIILIESIGLPKSLGLMLIPMMFAFVSMRTFLRADKRYISALLNIVVWFVIQELLMKTPDSNPEGSYIVCAGFLGGMGVALSDSICYRQLLHPTHLLACGTMGFLASFPFATATSSFHETGPFGGEILIVFGFALWQGLIGTYLYYICTKDKNSDEDCESE